MTVSLIGWGKFLDSSGKKVTVPAPNTDHGKPWLWDFLADEAPHLAAVGFDRIQLPPASKAHGGSAAQCDGYNVFDARDLGVKNQQGAVPTRYGPADSLRRLIAVAHSCGLSVDLDIVLHHLNGGQNGTYLYTGADGKSLIGRGAMHPGCFQKSSGGGTQPPDDVPIPGADSSSPGDRKVYQHSNPPRYTIDDALDYGDWLFRTTGADGGRIDDAQSLWPPFVAEFITHRSMANKQFYGQFLGGNTTSINQWATSSPMNSRCGVEDFNMHVAIENACNQLNASMLANSGSPQWNPGLCYGFVDNADTDTTSGEPVILCKLLGYAYLLTVNCKDVLVYGKDYYSRDVWPGAYALKPMIDNLVYINRTLAYGAETTRWVDNAVIVIERDGNGGSIGQSPGLLTAINFDPNNSREITCATSFGSNVQLHDYSGRHPDIRTDSQGNATFTIPPNTQCNGESYLCFSRSGSDKPVTHQARTTTQEFFGAPDLDIAPASPGAFRSIAKIYVQGNTAVTFLTHNRIEVALLDGAAPVPGNKAPKTGWYGVGVSSGSSTPLAFDLSVTYTGGLP